MVKLAKARAGFSLIELMIVVGILGVLAAIALPSFTTYLRRAKTVEARETLKQIYARVAVYYYPEITDQGIAGAQRVSCTVDSTDNAVLPTDTKQPGNYDSDTWQALGFAVPPSYYRYEIATVGGTSSCHGPANRAPLYELRARGDLNANGTQSLFEITVGTSGNNEVYRSPNFYIVDETE